MRALLVTLVAVTFTTACAFEHNAAPLGPSAIGSGAVSAVPVAASYEIGRAHV